MKDQKVKVIKDYVENGIEFRMSAYGYIKSRNRKTSKVYVVKVYVSIVQPLNGSTTQYKNVKTLEVYDCIDFPTKNLIYL